MEVQTTSTTRRGLTYWPGSDGLAPRLFSTNTDGLAALDPKTGALIPSFGEKGVIQGVRLSSPGSIYKNILMTQGGPGLVKAWDTVTGELRWTLNLKAQPGDPNAATWLNDSLNSQYTPGLWGIFTVDVERGLLFVPVEKVGNDYYGGPHHGNNLYSDSLLAVDVNTGKIKWYQQLVHHDIWDYDLAAQPTLVEARRNGRVVPGVALITKMGILFVFNRETGEPMYGMEERPVPQTSAKGEWTSPTQPFPLKPAPLARNSLKKSELATVTPELEAHCKGLWEKYNLSDAVPYDPWREKQDIVVFPGAIGGGNWQGVMFNRPLGLMITNVMNAGQWGHLEEGSGRRGGGRRGAPPGRRGRRCCGSGGRRPWRESWRGCRRTACRRRARRSADTGRAEHEQGHAGRRPLLGCGTSVQLRGPAVGRAGRGQRQQRRHRVARAARRVPRACRQGHQDRPADARRRDHDSREPGLHRRDDRRILPRDRREERRRAVAGKARRARTFHPLHLHGARRQAVRRRSRRRRRLPAKPNCGYADRIRLA